MCAETPPLRVTVATVMSAMPEKHVNAVIYGNPGIGKSWSMQYLLRRLLDCAGGPDGATKVGTIVWGRHGRFLQFARRAGGGWDVMRSSMCPHSGLLQPAFLLFDVCKEEVTERTAWFSDFVSCVFATSPDPQMYQHVRKALRPKFFIMEPWASEELVTVAPDFAEEGAVVRERVRVLGGIPRSVL